MIVLVGGGKGGVGKTTLAVNLAALRAAGGGDVLVVDTDSQGSANLWSEVRGAADGVRQLACVQKEGDGLARELLGLKERYGDVIVDAGGRDSVELRSALIVCDVAVFPLRPSLFDAATLRNVDVLVRDARLYNEGLVAWVVVNCASTHYRVQEADELRSLVGEYDGLGLVATVVRDRIAFRKSVKSGLGVVEVEGAGRDELAVREIEGLYGEVFGNGR